MRPRWGNLEQGLSDQVWADSRQKFTSKVVGPHFESVCREFAATRGRQLFGRPVGQVTSGTLTDPAERDQIEADVVVLGPAEPGQPREVISLGEAKWGEVMGTRHLARLRRAQAILLTKGFNASQAVLACYSGAGFDDELRAQAGPDLLLVDLSTLYD